MMHYAMRVGKAYEPVAVMTYLTSCSTLALECNRKLAITWKVALRHVLDGPAANSQMQIIATDVPAIHPGHSLQLLRK
eukprot:5811725-Amphidinium_carterae.1